MRQLRHDQRLRVTAPPPRMTFAPRREGAESQAVKRFLTAEWRDLAMVNFAIDPALLLPLVPRGTELDSWRGTTYISLVGFRFLDTALLSLPIPFHRNFEEVNLRFYVRRVVEDAAAEKPAPGFGAISDRAGLLADQRQTSTAEKPAQGFGAISDRGGPRADQRQASTAEKPVQGFGAISDRGGPRADQRQTSTVEKPVQGFGAISDRAGPLADQRQASTVRRGVVFIRELVPRWAIAAVARAWYNEPYSALPMRHRVSRPLSDVHYGWRRGGAWEGFTLRVSGDATPIDPGSEAEYITEHYWGYTAQRDGGSIEYQVEHPRWRAWPATLVDLTGDFATLYGRDFAAVLAQPPTSAFIADGSPVTVSQPRRLPR